MSTRADDVRREIEQSQAELGSTLEEIGDRVSPKKVVARAKDDVSDKVHDVGARVSPKRLLHRARESVMGSPTAPYGDGGNGSATARVRGQAEQLSGKASDVAKRARQAPQAVGDKAQGNPLAAGLVAFGAGLVAASLLRPSERERQMIQAAKEKMEPLKQGATDAGKQVAGELQESARSGVEQVKRRATEAAETVKEEGQTRAQRATGRAKGAVKEVKSEAKGATGEVKDRAASASGKVRNETQQTARRVKAGSSPARARPVR